MLRAAPFFLAALPAWADQPSPFVVTAHDVIVERQPGGEDWLVLRYLAPQIAGGSIGYETAAPELDRLCLTDGLAEAAKAGTEVAQIVIVLMDRPVERGVPDPGATQYIGAYLPIDGVCEWE